jgi:hypothetical protein
MIGTWVRRRRALWRRPVQTPPPDSAAAAPAPKGASKEAPVASLSLAPASKEAPADDPRLELYLQQIADLPAHDRAIIVGVLQSILDEEAAYARRVVSE